MALLNMLTEVPKRIKVFSSIAPSGPLSNGKWCYAKLILGSNWDIGYLRKSLKMLLLKLNLGRTFWVSCWPRTFLMVVGSPLTITPVEKYINPTSMQDSLVVLKLFMWNSTRATTLGNLMLVARVTSTLGGQGVLKKRQLEAFLLKNFLMYGHRGPSRQRRLLKKSWKG